MSSWLEGCSNILSPRFQVQVLVSRPCAHRLGLRPAGRLQTAVWPRSRAMSLDDIVFLPGLVLSFKPNVNAEEAALIARRLGN